MSRRLRLWVLLGVAGLGLVACGVDTSECEEQILSDGTVCLRCTEHSYSTGNRSVSVDCADRRAG